MISLKLALINTNSFSKIKLFTSSMTSLTILLEYNFPLRFLNFLLKKSILRSKFSIGLSITILLKKNFSPDSMLNINSKKFSFLMIADDDLIFTL